MTLNLTWPTSIDDSFEEISKRSKEPFTFHKFKYIENTLTKEEKRLLCERLPYGEIRGSKYQLFKDGKIKESTEEYNQFMNSEPASKPLQAWFKYQALLKEEDE